MPIKDNSNKVTEFVEMAFDASAVAVSIASLAQPSLAPLAPVFNLLSLPFAAHNHSLMRKQMKLLVDAFNNLETRLEKLENLNEEQKRIFEINGYKIIDCCLHEKMKEKINIYARIFSDGINSGIINEQNDLFDIQIDIINSLRLEDINLCRFLINYTKQETDSPFAYEFQIDDLEAFIVSNSNETETVNKYALRHLINLGLVDERIGTSAEINQTETIVYNDKIIYLYSLTQRFRMIYQIIVSSTI